MYVDTATLPIDSRSQAGRNEPNLRGPWPSGTRRVFWAIEPGTDIDAPEPEQPSTPGGLIEITLTDGIQVRVDNQVDSTALRRVLEALQGRATKDGCVSRI